MPDTILAAPGAGELRIEHDLLGDKAVPADAYWGVHTARALENFAVTRTGIDVHPTLVDGLVAVKQASARANRELGLLPEEVAQAIDRACADLLAGQHHDQFVVDPVQGGAGTSSNMNANEVVANLALEHRGLAKGRYDVIHPLEHVNMSQSTNDVYPTAVKVAVISSTVLLVEQMELLRDAFREKSREFATVVKMGRTQLQDAVPMTLGQEVGTYAEMLDEDVARLREATLLLHEINLGATAIGTGLNAPPGYAQAVCRELAAITGLPLVTAVNLVEATQDVGSFVQFSGVLKRISVKLAKTCNDLRLLSSGPRAGLHEINLPPVQAGSSIMPGKVNPVIPEMVNQVAFEVIGHDLTITMAAEGGQLQLNAFEPIIATSLLTSVDHLAAACRLLRERCVVGITANVEELAEATLRSIGLATALNPRLGYTVATQVAQEALASGRSVADIVLERGLLESEELAELLRPERLANLAVEPAHVPTETVGALSSSSPRTARKSR